uniref:tyrosine-type recombinase/integrase n=1 Tax=Acetatifactor sp. TaxID=1872090 RepID=UPI0040567981
MGKDLKGKKLPAGICQRKDGLYSARFTSKTGRRVEKFFKKPNAAKKWLEDAKYEDKHNNIGASSQMTVDAWFDYWIAEIKAPTVRFNTVRNYTERYNINIKPYLGSMIISEVKAMHCQNVLNAMAEKYKGSTIEQCRITMCSMFYYAAINGIIPVSPISKIVKLPKRVEKKVRFLTVEEQNKFLQQAEGSAYYHQFLLVLQTGLRTGELVGLKWEDLDFESRKITVSRSMEFRYGYQEFKIGEPKSKYGYRTIPMTQTAYDILRLKASEKDTRYVCDEKYADFVFLCRKGSPIKNSTYDTALYKLTEKAGIEHISMHTLRHTFATRCIEAGMRPKTLQGILGHANIGITMNLYVHNTEEEKEKEIKKFEEAFQLSLV